VIKKPSIKDVKKFLKRKIPVILSVNSRILYNNLKQKITGHFIVITKYKNGIFWYNDPKDGRRHSIKEDDLIFAWHNNILDSSGYLLIIEK
ncbi:C39 family peptidase, partial [Patescibacteria group bacterium]|nr:C39 family peptidase [Patescibacteria group bacterium]